MPEAPSCQLPAPSSFLLEAGSWKLEAFTHQPLTHCMCDFVVGKTTVCRIFNCQRSLRGTSPRGNLRRPRGDFPRTPFARSLAGPQRPTPFARGILELYLARPPNITIQFSDAACLAEARFNVNPSERRLENTGLEPVTSWLQTRRSPS
jgi:hypothetical protein